LSSGVVALLCLVSMTDMISGQVSMG